MEYINVLDDSTLECIDNYCQVRNMKGRSPRETRNNINLICRELGKSFVDLTEQDATKWQQSMLNKLHHQQINVRTYRARLITYQGFAEFLKNEKLMAYNPFDKIEIPIVSSIPLTEKIPSAEACDKILVAAEAEGRGMYVAVAMVLRMGLSSRNITDLLREDVVAYDDMVYVILRDTDNEEARYVVVPDDVKGILQDYLRSSNSKYVFPTIYGKKISISALNKRIRKIVAAAGVGDFSLKDLRNRAIYQMLHDGADVSQVADYLNITDGRIKKLKRSPLASSVMLSICPANTSKMRIITEEEE